MSQEKIAKKIGVSQPAYAKAERGETNPTKYIEKIAETFNVDKSEIEQGKEGQVINNYGHIEIGYLQNQYNMDNLSLPEIKDVLNRVTNSLNKLIEKND